MSKEQQALKEHTATYDAITAFIDSADSTDSKRAIAIAHRKHVLAQIKALTMLVKAEAA